MPGDSAAVTQPLKLLDYRIDQLERAAARKADQGDVSELARKVDTKADADDVVTLASAVDDLHEAVNKNTRTLIGVIVSLALAATTVSGTMFILLAGHIH